MQIMAGLALAAAAGLNAFLPLLILGFAMRLGHRAAPAPYGVLASPVALGLLLVLLPIEIFADKIPGPDVLNDRAGIIYRPLAGAIVMAVATWETGLPGVAAMVIGAAVALGVHLLKLRYRRPLGRVLAGLGQPVASLAEDFACVLVSFFALLLPILGFVLGVIVVGLVAACGVVLQRRALPARTAQ